MIPDHKCLNRIPPVRDYVSSVTWKQPRIHLDCSSGGFNSNFKYICHILRTYNELGTSSGLQQLYFNHNEPPQLNLPRLGPHRTYLDILHNLWPLIWLTVVFFFLQLSPEVHNVLLLFLINPIIWLPYVRYWCELEYWLNRVFHFLPAWDTNFQVRDNYF